MKLAEQVQKEVDENINVLPKPMRNYVKKLIKKVGSETKPLQVGGLLPQGTLLTPRGEKTDIKKLLKGKPTIINFYRGSWCPYCNLELAYWDDILGEEENRDVNMISISPERPDITKDNLDTEELNFGVFSDINNTFAKEMGLSHKLPFMMKLLVRSKGNSLKKSQGNSDYELPVPGVFVIDKNGVIQGVWADSDFTKRPEPEEVLAVYNKLK